jgi:poly-gamma-glutamate synthesis protein (capsule biosynthesis protein)
VILLFFLHFSHGRLDSDNGIFLSGAWNLINNFNIYNDFFSFTTPGTYYVILGVWKIFGISYWAAWAVGILSLLISSILIFKITKYLDHFSAYLATVLFCLIGIGWPIITSHVFCLPFILGAVLLLIMWSKNHKTILLYLSGFLVGVSVLFLQTIGLATFAGLLLFLVWFYFKNRKILTLKNLLGFILFSWLPITFLFLKWSPLFLFNTLIKFPLLNYGGIIPTDYSLLAINFLFLLFFFLVLNKNNQESIIIKLLSIWQSFLLLTALSFPDFSHISFVSAPLLILFTIFSSEISKSKINKKSIKFLIIIFLFLGYFLFYFLRVIYYSDAPFFTFKNETPATIEFLRENCQTKYIYAGPFLPEFYFETRKLTPGPTDWLLTNHHPKEFFLETAEKLNETKADCAIVNYEMVRKLNYNQNNPVDNYLLSHYQPVKQFGSTFILKRLSDKDLNNRNQETINKENEIISSGNFAHLKNEETENKSLLKFLFFGDLMLDRNVGDRLVNKNISYLLSNLAGAEKQFFSGYDIISANLEGAVTDNGNHYAPINSYDFAFSPSRINELKDYGFNYFSSANNHFSDQGQKGVDETRKNLSALNFNFSGSTDSKIDAYSRKDIVVSNKKIAMISLSMVYHDFDLEAAKKIVKEAKETSDLVIVNIHWGNEYQHQFNKHQQTIGHALIDSGADLIIGHHPHVTQGMEIYKDKIIFYSLGNFIFDQYFSTDTQEELAVGISIEETKTSISLFPLKSEKSAPRLMNEVEKEKFLKNFISWSEVNKDNNLETEINNQLIIIPQIK